MEINVTVKLPISFQERNGFLAMDTCGHWFYFNFLPTLDNKGDWDSKKGIASFVMNDQLPRYTKMLYIIIDGKTYHFDLLVDDLSYGLEDEIHKLFQNYEIHPVKSVGWYKEKEQMEQCDEDDPDIKFWSIYGHFSPESEQGGGLECVMDCKTKEAAEFFFNMFEETKK